MTTNSNKIGGKVAKKRSAKPKTPSKSSTKFTDKDIAFIYSEGGDKEFRKKIVKLCHKKDICITVLEPGCFDYGIKRSCQKRDGYAAVYDYDKTVDALATAYMEWNNDNKKSTRENAETDAMEWVDYNDQAEKDAEVSRQRNRHLQCGI